ncbi:two-component sensor histidine kinase [Paenibacillus tritici]|uniref:histidine kinase n=1 Tax=Paenibacillus tritici TaxID=1873425 RepID=A0ABX2DGV7_9BACL|nr:histidine kinase [Paenibacillus tritici]NQX43745.1 two-component sensor histidine kinase [Paenibacillus tritici]QUL57305.1 two-component sensor histidine kinase [Paenibacillus tritici]
MTYTRIKVLILLIPTVMVGIWEWVRHQFLMSYISMDTGNYLTPVLVFMFSIILLLPLFRIMERNQRELEQERAATGAMEAREALAKELHDGMAQSLFLLSVRIDRLEQSRKDGSVSADSVDQIKKTVHEVNRYVRQAIANLKVPVSGEESFSLERSIKEQLAGIAGEVMIEVSLDWHLEEQALTAAEQAELLSCIREAIINVRKHTRAGRVSVSGQGNELHWTVTIADNGAGIQHDDPFAVIGSYGLQIMRERSRSMGWRLDIQSGSDGTTVEIAKGGAQNGTLPGTDRR